MQLKKILDSNKTSLDFDLEIIVPSYDSYKDITANLYHLFKVNEIKITILESFISENIIDLCIKNNISLYERLSDDSPEKYFLYYINNYVCHKNSLLFIYADEYLSFDDYQFLFGSKFDLFYLNRYEYFYNSNSNLCSKQLRGGKAEIVKIISKSFDFKNSYHDFWIFNNSNNLSELSLQVKHLHKYDVLNDYGKSSKYVFEEMKILSQKGNFQISFFKRFILRFFTRLLNFKLFLFNKKIYLYLLFAQIIESSNAILFILEKKLKKIQ